MLCVACSSYWICSLNPKVDCCNVYCVTCELFFCYRPSLIATGISKSQIITGIRLHPALFCNTIASYSLSCRLMRFRSYFLSLLSVAQHHSFCSCGVVWHDDTYPLKACGGKKMKKNNVATARQHIVTSGRVEANPSQGQWPGWTKQLNFGSKGQALAKKGQQVLARIFVHLCHFFGYLKKRICLGKGKKKRRKKN